MNAEKFESDGAARIALCVTQACGRLGYSHEQAHSMVSAVIIEVAINDVTHPWRKSMHVAQLNFLKLSPQQMLRCNDAEQKENAS